MKRRRLLAAAGPGLGALCGCLDRIAGGGAGTGDGAGTDEESTGVRVLDATATPEVITMGDDSIGVGGGREGQFLIATVGTDEGVSPAPEEFALETGSESYRPSEDLTRNRSLWDYDRPYDPERRDTGWIGFALPNPLQIEGEGAAITWPGGEHALDDDAVAELARPPTDFPVREFAAPATVENPGTVTLSLTVENVGEETGTFVGALNRVGPRIAYAPEAAIRLGLEPGETAVWEYEYGVSTTREDAEVRFHLHWRDGSASREVDIGSE